MQRTQIYLTKSQKEQLGRLARRKQTTASALIRKFIGKNLPSKIEKEKGKKKQPALLEVAKEINQLGFSGPSDLAENLDEYLYGGKK